MGAAETGDESGEEEAAISTDVQSIRQIAVILEVLQFPDLKADDGLIGIWELFDDAFEKMQHERYDDVFSKWRHCIVVPEQRWQIGAWSAAVASWTFRSKILTARSRTYSSRPRCSEGPA